MAKVNCPNHDHSLLCEIVNGKVQVKCRKCKKIIEVNISTTPPVAYAVPEFVKEMIVK